MKKLVLVPMFLLLSMFLFACTVTVTPPKPEKVLTNYEMLELIISEFDLGQNHSDVKGNLVLPKVIRKYDKEVFVTWQSTDAKAVNDEGHVNRDENANKNITLTGNFTLDTSFDYLEMDLVVSKLPANNEEKLDEAITDLILFPNDKVDSDFLILPRVGLHNSRIEWTTSNANIVDLDGNVTQLDDKEQTVTLTAKFNVGETIREKAYVITVDEKRESKYEQITENDDRILKKITVNNKTELISALKKAIPGDAIILNDGTYSNINITMSASGTEKNPVFILAKNPGKAKITGESFLNIKANDVITAGLLFTDGNPLSDRGAIWLEGNNLRLSNTAIYNFEKTGLDYKWVSLTGQNHEVDNCTFDGKITGGALLTV